MDPTFEPPVPSRRKPGSETEAHRRLKRAAADWAVANRLPLLGFEVRVPRGPYRADVAALSRRPSADSAVAALFECKQARSDFLRDEADEPVLRRETAECSARLQTLRSLVAGHRPDLRKGESLFPEYDDWDLRGLRHDGLERLQRDLEVRQRKIVASVKFARLHRYHAADYLYLVTTAGLIESHEVPSGWGWLELPESGQGLVLRAAPLRHVTSPGVRMAWLESVALSGSRAHLRSLPPLITAAAPAATGERSVTSNRT
ncbi:MAG: hypothetical protein U1F61_30010 [Opitutaceae bacterium]|jgi:hypothetical protein